MLTSTLIEANEEDQNAGNLDIVANVLGDIADLLEQGGNFTVDESVRMK